MPTHSKPSKNTVCNYGITWSSSNGNFLLPRFLTCVSKSPIAMALQQCDENNLEGLINRLLNPTPRGSDLGLEWGLKFAF